MAVTLPKSARPCSKGGPHIFSHDMNTLIALPMKPFLPYIAQVTTVLSPCGLNVKSAVAIFELIPNLVGDGQFDAFLTVTRFHSDLNLRKAAAECARAILKRSSIRTKLLEQVNAALKEPGNAQTRDLLLRIQSTGG